MPSPPSHTPSHKCITQHTLHTSAAGPQCPDVGLNAGGTLELVLHEVGVVGGVDEIGGEGLGQVLVHSAVLDTHHISLITQEIVGETCTKE